jgi:Ca-activated chloride channel family protein
MEQTAFDAERFEEYENVYQWPLALALLLLAADPLVRTRRRQQGEDKG